MLMYSVFAPRAAIAALSAFCFAAVVTLVSTAALAQSDTLLGTWKLIPERSTFPSGPLPYRSMTLKFSTTERGLKNDVHGVDADGRSIDAAYTIVADGKYYPVTGVSAFDSSSYTPVSDRNTVYIRRKLGTTVIVGSRVVSRDGKTLTFREKTVDGMGRETGRALLVFEKE